MSCGWGGSLGGEAGEGVECGDAPEAHRELPGRGEVHQGAAGASGKREGAGPELNQPPPLPWLGQFGIFQLGEHEDMVRSKRRLEEEACVCIPQERKLLRRSLENFEEAISQCDVWMTGKIKSQRVCFFKVAEMPGIFRRKFSLQLLRRW